MAMVSSSMGPINSLLDKLAGISELTDLSHGLESIKKHLLGFSTRGVVRNIVVWGWMTQQCELAYDMEDWIDDLLIRSRGCFHPELWTPDDREKIDEFKIKIHRAHDLGARYGLLRSDLGDLVKVNGNPEDNNPGELLEEVLKKDGLLRGEKPGFIGLEGSESELACHLLDDEKKRKVISILGPGGLGKTTLARQVFHKNQSHFECTAFVYVGQNPSIGTIIVDMARQILPQGYPFDADEDTMFTIIWEFLRNKRYLVVIDDIRSTSHWSTITFALPESIVGSRIVVTTRIKDVAKTCSIPPNNIVHSVKALSESDSKSLFLATISAPEHDWAFDYQSMFISGGTPLAIILAARLCSMNCSQVSSLLHQDFIESEGVAKILELSYADLSLHMMSCFVYFTAFPRNCTIMKDRLIQRWLGEGFIPKGDKESLWETGERCFKELATRRLIELVFNEDDDQPIGCTVHPMIYDFMLLLSTEHNLVTHKVDLSYGSFPLNTVRRFYEAFTDHRKTLASASRIALLSRVRSLTTGNTDIHMISLSDFKCVRVLDLQDAKGVKLHGIGSLVLLTYLGLKGSDVRDLPHEINTLQNLTTLDIRGTVVNYLPEFTIVKLKFLLADQLVVSNGIRSMDELEEVQTILVGHNYQDDAADLVIKLKVLRVLGVKLDHHIDQAGLLRLLGAVCKSNLQTIIIYVSSDEMLDLLLDCWGQRRFKKFELFINQRLSQVPRKMACLKDVTHLHINVFEVEVEGLHVLQNLPNLVLLHLTSHNTPKRCIISKRDFSDCFQCLKIFVFRCLDGGMGLQFGPGAMPQLQRLKLFFGVEETKPYGDFDFGIQHLTCLVHVSLTINCSVARSCDVESVETMMRDQVSNIPNCPVLVLKKIYEGHSI